MGPSRTCTESIETLASHSLLPRCTERWPADIELDQVASRFYEPSRSNPTSADDHRTSRCTTLTSSSHSHDESCPRRHRPPDDLLPSDQTPSTKCRFLESFGVYSTSYCQVF